jgi:hypothetical protein
MVLGLSDLIRAELLGRRLPCGRWSWLPNLCQAALEATCLAFLVLASASQSPDLQPLLEQQLKDGSWPALDGDTEPSGLTGLALITLNTLGGQGVSRQRAQEWLLMSRGRESQWPWKWKFRALDARVQFDPDKFGWPWQPATCSWVVPTALSVLALKQTPASSVDRRVAHRIRRGVEMLLDRACPQGGWNAGNGVVYGSAMALHLDATALVLLALQDEPLSSAIRLGLRWLEQEALLCPAPWSLAWVILALDVYDRGLRPLQDQLLSITAPLHELDTATLAVALLALGCETGKNPFEVRV